MNIIKIVEETYLNTYPEELGITYLGTELNIEKALEGMEAIFENQGEKVPELSEMVRKWLGAEDKVNELVKKLKDYYIPEDDFYAYETLEDFFFEDPEFFIQKILDSTEKTFEFFEDNDIQLGTVGYSPWSYYIAPMDICSSFIQDLWEGWNFYSLSLLDENGKAKDSIWGEHIPDTEALIEAVYNYFGIKNFYLVDNQEATYMNHKKVREIEKVERFYKII